MRHDRVAEREQREHADRAAKHSAHVALRSGSRGLRLSTSMKMCAASAAIVARMIVRCSDVDELPEHADRRSTIAGMSA